MRNFLEGRVRKFLEGRVRKFLEGRVRNFLQGRGIHGQMRDVEPGMLCIKNIIIT